MDRQVQTILSGAKQNGAWYEFQAQGVGKVATKKLDIAQQAQKLQGQTVTISITEQVSTNINPHTNQPFVNRYLNSAVPSSGVAAEAHQQPVQATQGFVQAQPQVGPTDRDTSIYRQTATKVAAHLLSHFPEQERTLNSFEKLTARLIQFYGSGQWSNEQAIAAEAQAVAAETGGTFGVPTTDDDIPF